MKFTLSLILLLVLLPVLSADVSAETHSQAAQDVEALRAQLTDVQSRETELQAHARQLDEDLKPENIERSLAGVGSTKPEELRELRRRQLTIERDSVSKQLNLLAASREGLESAIRRAEGFAYQQSAEGFTSPITQAMIAQTTSNSRLTVALFAGAVAMLATMFAALIIRRAIKKT